MKFQITEMDRPRVEIVPMIDTIFFLLVFFMFSSLSLVHMNGMGLMMPKDGGGKAHAPKQIVVAVNPQGRYYVNAHALDSQQLAGALKQQLAANPGAAVVVNVASNQKTDTLIATMDIVNEILTQSGSKAPIIVATSPVKMEKSHAAAASPH